MSRWRLHLRWLSWITTCVVLFGSVAPAVSSTHAWVAGGPLLADVCSVSGMPLGQDDAPAGPLAKTVHCAFCLLQSDGAALLPTLGRLPQPLPWMSGAVIPTRSVGVQARRPWAPAAPRGPPASFLL